MMLDSWVGTPYILGGSLPNQGMDCAGLVIAYAQTQGIEIPRKPYGYRVRTTVLQCEISKYAKFIEKEERREGDILVFRPGHLGIMVEEGCFAHVIQVDGVVISKLYGKWVDRLLSVWRLYESE